MPFTAHCRMAPTDFLEVEAFGKTIAVSVMGKNIYLSPETAWTVGNHLIKEAVRMTKVKS